MYSYGCKLVHFITKLKWNWLNAFGLNSYPLISALQPCSKNFNPSSPCWQNCMKYSDRCVVRVLLKKWNLWDKELFNWEEHVVNMLGTLIKGQVHLQKDDTLFFFLDRIGLASRMKIFFYQPQIFFSVWFLALTLSQTSPGFYISAVQVFWTHYG